MVHGDDFTFAGIREELEKVKRMMQEWYDIKMRGIMGSGEDEVKEVEILGRRVRWTAEGIEYEGDGSHREALLSEEGLSGESKTVVSPVERSEGRPDEGDGVELQGEERRRFRSMAARLNYIGQDRSDIQYATRGVCAEMARPTEGGKKKIKRVVRYLLGVEKVVWRMSEWDDGEEVKVEVYVDSDWAKESSRKSTSGGMLVVGGVGVKHWSRTQATRALSVGEAEYYAITTGCKEGLGMQSLLRDMGWEAEVVIWSDSSTAKGIASRRGLGKMRHVELRYLWVQEAVRGGRLSVRKVGGRTNVADHLTKGKAVWEFKELLEKVGARMEGRGCDGNDRWGRWRGSQEAVEGEDWWNGQVGSLVCGGMCGGCSWRIVESDCRGRGGGCCGSRGVDRCWSGRGGEEWRPTRSGDRRRGGGGCGLRGADWSWSSQVGREWRMESGGGGVRCQGTRGIMP